MAHVREVARKGGKAFEVRWRDAGRERQRTFPVVVKERQPYDKAIAYSRQRAERFAAKVENTIADGAMTAPLVKQTKTVAEVVAATLAASRPRLKASTYAGYEQLYGTRVLPTFGKQRIATVTSEQVEAWIAELIAGGREASTVRNHFVALHKVFR